ncbi:anthranilate synthase component II [Enterococcus sp.]|uniref:anthranilate synthase component II n=1 Tax=Enterococcus sp. TaxID=35783 RepID=UPI002FC7EB0A
MILLVDNYDSFTYNLVQQFADFPITVLRNDDPNLLAVAKEAKGIVLSPGPGLPHEAGLLTRVIEQTYREKPILGICLGHQGLGEVFGGKVIRAPKIVHGKQSVVSYEKSGLFQTIEGELEVMRYHSYIVERETLPECLTITAECSDGIMALQHKEYPVFGLQFHPESLGTPQGQRMIDEFIKIVEAS